MMDRRRTTRFVIPDASEASLRLMQDVFVERIDARGAVVISDTPLPRHEDLLLELPRELGARTVVAVRVESASTIGIGEPRRYRAVLCIAQPAAEAAPAASAGEAVRPVLPAIGLVVRRVSVRVGDVSASGCLLESADVLPEAAVGLLEIAVHGERHTETLRVCRSMRIPGNSARWRSGATFLALNAPLPTSVRNMVARFEIVDELAAATETTLDALYRRYSGPPTYLS